MDTKQVVITVRADGSTHIDAIGFNGVGCLAATEALEANLAGSGKVDKDLKPEANNFEIESSGQTEQY